MNKLLFLILFVCAVSVQGQRPTAGRLMGGPGVPTVDCNPGSAVANTVADVYVRTDVNPHTLYICSSAPNGWTLGGGSGGLVDPGSNGLIKRTALNTTAVAGASDLPSAIDAAKLADGSVSNAELQRLDGVSSAIQTQLDAKQAGDADLASIAGLAPTNDDVIQRKSGSWVNRSMAQIKTDLALNNVDNTSDATKNAASVTLANKTLTSPVINSPTGIVKGDVGLGNVDNTSDTTKNAASVTLSNKTIALGSNTVSGTIAQFNTAVTDADFMTLGNAEAVTGAKTFTDSKLILNGGDYGAADGSLPGSPVEKAFYLNTNSSSRRLFLYHGSAFREVFLSGISGPMSAANGGFGTDVSASSGVPLFAAGVPTFTSTSGSGNFARVTSPTFVTPTLGAAVATSINGNTFTTGTYTLTGSSGKTLTFSNSLTLAGTDGTTMTFPSGSGAVVTADSTTTKTNLTLDTEGTGNVFTSTHKTWFAAAGCNNATAASFWDLGTSLAPTPTCKNSSSGNAQNASLDFPDSDGMYFGQTQMMLPEDFTGTVDAKIKWMAAATSGDVIWNVSTICVADGETDAPAFNTVSTVTDTAKGTTLQLNDAAITSVVITGCASGELMHIKISRDRTTSGDTITGVVSFLGLQITTRRGQ
jgi:hypothetical protein